MRKPKNHQLKLAGLLVVPVILALAIRMYYVSSPQYALKNFFAVVRSKDTEAAKHLTTPGYFGIHNSGRPEDPFFYKRSWEKEMPFCRNIVWQRPDSTHANVTYKMSDGSFFQYYLLRTPSGWKIDGFDGSIF